MNYKQMVKQGAEVVNETENFITLKIKQKFSWRKFLLFPLPYLLGAGRWKKQTFRK